MSDPKDAPRPPLKGTVEECPTCDKPTPHLTAEDGWPVCGWCVTVHPPVKKEDE